MVYALLQHLIVPRAFRKIQRIHGLENIPREDGFLLAANHVSWLDPVYLTAAVSQRFRNRFLFVSATGKHRWTQAVIPIDKKNRARCLTLAMEELQKGHAIGIFPRGDQRDSSGHAMTGIARLAHWSGLPLLPAAIRNLTPAHTWKSLFYYFFRRHSVEIVFGKPMFFSHTDQVSHEQLQADMLQIESAIHALMNQ